MQHGGFCHLPYLPPPPRGQKAPAAALLPFIRQMLGRTFREQTFPRSDVLLEHA